MAYRSLVNGKRNVYDGVCNQGEGTMKADEHWANLAKGILRAEMARRSITYENLSEKLAEMGIQDSAVNIRNKVARGGFSAAFLIQALRAMDVREVRID